MVTMKWWDDLWLKESFADLFAVIGMAEAEELKNYKNSDFKYILY
jgi:aminopeptidase N